MVSGAAEADFDLGMRGNVDGTRAVLEHARRHRAPPVLVFSSSLAVFGAGPGAARRTRPAPVGDDTLPRPQSSYGIQKFIGEQLVADYTRKGFVRGRSVRLMTVSVRPGKPNAAASSFMSGIIREPLAGLRATCPVPPDTPVALSSPRRTLEGILRAAAVSDAAWGSRTAMNLPALTTTPRAMADAHGPGRRLRRERPHRLDRRPGDRRDRPQLAGQVETPRAAALGLRPETSFDDIVREYVDAHGPAAPRRSGPRNAACCCHGIRPAPRVGRRIAVQLSAQANADASCCYQSEAG